MTNSNGTVAARLARQLGIAVTRARNGHLADVGLTVDQADALTYYADHPGVTIADWKNQQHIAHQTARLVVQKLVERGLIISTPSATDSRAKVNTLSPAGEAVRGQMYDGGEVTGRKLLAGLSGDQQAQFIQLLRKCLDNLDS